MTFEGFEHLLESLGLGNIIINDHDVSIHKEEEFRNPHNTHDHAKKENDDQHNHNHAASSHHSTRSPRILKTLTTIKQSTYPTSAHGQSSETNTISSDAGHSSSGTEASQESPQSNSIGITTDPGEGRNVYHYKLPEAEIPELLVNISSLVDQHQELGDDPHHFVLEQCLSPREILEAFGITQNSSLNPVSFLHLCPAIIYELDQGHCLFRDLSYQKHHSLPTALQWIYTLLAVFIISLCGLLSVAIIPIMQKWFYHTLLQFLVALAVGSLSGDALLHLLPHAMLSGDGTHGSSSLVPEIAEQNAVWKGFAVLGGTLFFFIAEKVLSIFTAQKDATAEFQEIDQESVQYSEGSTELKLSQHRKSSGLELTNKEMMLMLAHTSPAKEIPELAGHGHGHGHSHNHKVPDTVSAVAWMVIMGDGLHNFCDGLAIGAAFASGIEGGISTTVAVFCHELPHELGDFAMLLQTGMGAKRALLYNILSSVLCLAGAAVGLCLSGIMAATGWVFAVTAGIFLYVAFVDMMPELRKNDSGSFNELAINVLGISTGAGLMLIIAMYEHDLKALVS